MNNFLGFDNNPETKIVNNHRDNIKFIEMSKLHINENNYFYTLSDVDELANNIKELGLIQPIEVTIDNDGEVVILGGHRRMAALKQILKNGSTFRYKEHICDEHSIPVNMFMYENNDINATKALLASNSYRRKSGSELYGEIKLAEKIYESECSLNTIKGRKVDYIGKLLGVSGKTISRTIAEFEPKNSDTEHKNVCTFKILKQIKSLEKGLNNYHLPDQLTETEMDDFNNMLKALSLLQKTVKNFLQSYKQKH